MSKNVLDVYVSQFKMSESDLDFVNKGVSIAKYWSFTEKNQLAISLTEIQLKEEYGFTDEQYNKLMTEVVGYKILDASTLPTAQPLVHIENGALYISHEDLTAGAFAVVASAASIGPAALQAALVAVSAAFGGPVGAILSTILTVIAAPSLVELAGRIIWAVGAGQGIYIKPVLSYPPLDIGYW